MSDRLNILKPVVLDIQKKVKPHLRLAGRGSSPSTSRCDLSLHTNLMLSRTIKIVYPG